MGWAVGFDPSWGRDVGYGVPALCDYPGCEKRIDRGLGYVCGGEPYGGERGCGLYFCVEHLQYAEVQLCIRCYEDDGPTENPFKPKPDLDEWVQWKLTHHSWAQWRREHPEEVERMRNRG